jgi:arylsulfatase A-like enzyme
MVDQHILRVLESLEESGLRKDTILVFASDHGEYGAAHSKMIEKWHSAYQEILHVPVLVSSPHINHRKDQPKQVDQLTSHIDLLPTLLGLANISESQQQDIKNQLAMDHYVCDFPGRDLSALIDPENKHCDENSDELSNRSLLFVTDDMITEPLPLDDDPHNKESWEQYTVYNAVIEELKKQQKFSQLDSGPVTQPAHVRSVRSGDWKLVKYCDPWSHKPVADQWELYNLNVDGNELCNLLVYNAEEFPTVIADDNIPKRLKMSREQIKDMAKELNVKLIQLELENLTPYPSAHPSSGN